MALIYDQAAGEGVVAVARRTLEGLADFPDARGGASPLARGFVSDVPLAVYSLGLDSLGEGADFGDAKAVAWRVFVVDGRNEPVGAAEMAPPVDGRPARFLGYTQGLQVASSGRALTVAEAAPAAQGRFEPRFLEIPALNTTALWLKDLGGDRDRIVPVDPIPRFLRDQDAYSPDEFLARLRTQAAKKLRFDDAPERPGPGAGPPPEGPAGA